MSRFAFSLQPVLDHKAHLRDLAMQALAAAIQQETALHDEIVQLRSQLPALPMQTPGNPVAVARLADASRTRAELQKRIEACKARRAEAEHLVRQRRDELAEADREVKTFETLRNRQLAEHYSRQQKAREMELLERLVNSSQRRAA